MPTALGSSVRSVLRTEPLNIALFHISDELDARLCWACPKHVFYLVNAVDWNVEQTTPPPNLVFLSPERFPAELDFDLMIGPLGAHKEFALALGIPFITLILGPTKLSAKRRAKLLEKAGPVRVVSDEAHRLSWNDSDIVLARSWDKTCLRTIIEGAAAR